MSAGQRWPVGGVPVDERQFCTDFTVPGVVVDSTGAVLLIDGTLFAVPVAQVFCDDVVVWRPATSEGTWLSSWSTTRSYERTPLPASGTWLDRRFNRDDSR
jgi:hypothetical protein